MITVALLNLLNSQLHPMMQPENNAWRLSNKQLIKAINQKSLLYVVSFFATLVYFQ